MMKINMDIRFAPVSTLKIQIRHFMKPVLKPKRPLFPSLSQMLPPLKPVVPPSMLEAVRDLGDKPFADLMLHPAKVDAVLQATRAKNATVRRPGDHSRLEFRNTEFFLTAPGAKSVKLVADFTDWHQAPLDMIKSEYGVWFIVVPLPPGIYSYGYIVDGIWCDNAASARQHKTRKSGITNAVITVA